jgi:hypothetical protein
MNLPAASCGVSDLNFRPSTIEPPLPYSLSHWGRGAGVKGVVNGIKGRVKYPPCITGHSHLTSPIKGEGSKR